MTKTSEYILIPGMHRSGTSMVANLLVSLGFDMGHSAMEGDASNPEGFYENTQIVGLHDTLLEQMGSSWCDPHPLPDVWLTDVVERGFFPRLQRVLQSEFTVEGPRLVKDPRLCRLLPLWQRYLGEERGTSVVYILPIRSPWEVAQSLQARDGFSMLLGLLLWTQHVLAAERSTRGTRRLFLSHAEVIEGTAIPALAAFLNLAEAEVSRHHRVVVKSSLHRQKKRRDDLLGEHPIVILAESCWEAMNALGKGDATAQGELEGLWQRYLSIQQCIPPDFYTRPFRLQKEVRKSALYLNYGPGFDHAAPLLAPFVDTDQGFRLVFNLPQGQEQLQRLRWDPIEGEACRLTRVHVTTEVGPLQAIPFNAVASQEGVDVFYVTDPVYELMGDLKQVQSVIITGELEILSTTEVLSASWKERTVLLDLLCSTQDELGRLQAISDKQSSEQKRLQTSPELSVVGSEDVPVCRADAREYTNTLEQWKHRSWFTRTFHKFRPDERRGALMAELERAAPGERRNEMILKQGTALTLHEIERLKKLRKRWGGRMVVRSRDLRVISAHWQRAQKHLSLGESEKALRWWYECVLHVRDVLQCARKRRVGKWLVRKHECDCSKETTKLLRLLRQHWERIGSVVEAQVLPTETPLEMVSGVAAPTVPFFDQGYYLATQLDVADTGIPAWSHYISSGWLEGRNPSPWFDVTWYLSQNPDVVKAKVEPLQHYYTQGWRELRDPHPEFDTSWYLEANPDVASSGINPLYHFLSSGEREGRRPNPYVPMVQHPGRDAGETSTHIWFILGEKNSEREYAQAYWLANRLVGIGCLVFFCHPDARKDDMRYPPRGVSMITFEQVLQDDLSLPASGVALLHLWSEGADSTPVVERLKRVRKWVIVTSFSDGRTSLDGWDRGDCFTLAKIGNGHRSVSMPRFAGGAGFCATPRLLAERRRYGIADHETTIAIPGDLGDEIGQQKETWYKAVQILQGRGFPVRLLCETAPGQVSSGADHSLLVLGRQSYSGLHRLLAMADFLVLPRGDVADVATGTLLPEFLAMGRPILAQRSFLPMALHSTDAVFELDVEEPAGIADYLSDLTPDLEACETRSLSALRFYQATCDVKLTAIKVLRFYREVLHTVSGS